MLDHLGALRCAGGPTKEAANLGDLQRRLSCAPERPKNFGARDGATEKGVDWAVIAIAMLALPFGNTCLDAPRLLIVLVMGASIPCIAPPYIRHGASARCDAGYGNGDLPK